MKIAEFKVMTEQLCFEKMVKIQVRRIIRKSSEIGSIWI
jgi:hypothetical protein